MRVHERSQLEKVRVTDRCRDDTSIGTDNIDDYLLETLDIDVRVEDDKITTDSRQDFSN